MTEDKMREAINRAFEDWSSRRIGSSGLASWLAFEGGYLAASQEIEALRAQVQDQALHLISAHAQAEEAHADAQRYRWLREQCKRTATRVRAQALLWNADANPAGLDEAIAAAMKGAAAQDRWSARPGGARLHQIWGR